MSEESLERFRQLVLQDPVLQARLRETDNREAFLALVVQLAEALGYQLTAEEVETALRISRRVWLERGIPG